MGLFNRLFYKRRKFYDDDFDWDSYTQDSYQRRLEGVVERQSQAVAGAGELSFDAASGRVASTGRALHPNITTILEAIGQLAPASVHEVGCGAGDHLANGMGLFPAVHFTGGDRGQGQLDLALNRHPALAGRIGLQDITMPLSSHWPRADFVYSQAVVMHIHTAVSHFVALANMVALASKHVLLMENVQCHDFVRDLRGLADGGQLAWPDLHLYRFAGSAGAPALIASAIPLDLPEARDDGVMRVGVAPSRRRLTRAAEDSARAIFGAPHWR